METDKKTDQPEKPVQGTTITTMNGASFVQVVAPMDLQEGYQLQVDVNGSVQTVTVPSGGVKEGQSFQAQPTGASAVAANGVVHMIPEGKWRDNLCNCCAFGPCHPMCCLGYWCQPVLAGQVMTRMSRDFLGGPGARPSVSNTCMIVTGIYFFVIVADLILSSVSGSTQCGGTGGLEEYDPDAGEYRIKCDDGTWEDKTSTTEITSAVYSVIAVLFWLYMLVVVCRTRKHMREKYNIPQGSCGALDDCCCSCWCGCCAIQQMARHTNDYNQFDVGCCSSDCCNKRGQQTIVPEIV